MTDSEILSLMDGVQFLGQSIDCFSLSEKLPDIKYSSGVSKHCYIFQKEDFVVKFPKNRAQCENLKVCPCQLEVDFYEGAKSYRVQQVLLPASFLGYNSNGIPFFKQSRIDFTSYNMPSGKITKYTRMTRNINPSLLIKIQQRSLVNDRPLDTLWLKMLWLLYGEKFLRSFDDWRIKNQVNDLHSSNIGYLKDRPVIMDYCGYHGW